MRSYQVEAAGNRSAFTTYQEAAGYAGRFSYARIFKAKPAEDGGQYWQLIGERRKPNNHDLTYLILALVMVGLVVLTLNQNE